MNEKIFRNYMKKFIDIESECKKEEIAKGKDVKPKFSVFIFVGIHIGEN